MKTAIELAARLSARYLDTKQMLPDELAHESAAMILQQAEQIEQLEVERLRLAGERLKQTGCSMTSIPTRKIEMKTVQQMLDLKPTTLCPALYKWSIKAAAMIRQQAEQIEALTKMLVISDDTHQTWMKANAPSGWIDDLRIERDALKADAKRLDLLESTFFAKRWNGVLDSGSRTTWCIVPGYQHSTNQMVGHTFRAAIDAMKGKS